MNNIKRIREILEYSPTQFAKLLRTTQETILAWEDGFQEPNYDDLRLISLLFHLSPDFVTGKGIFSKWDQILEYYDAVSWQLQAVIPHSLFLPTFCENKYLNVWLDTRRYYDPDELELSRWFAFALQEIHIVPTGEDLGGTKTANVDIVFTPEFDAIIQAELFSRNSSAEKQQKIIRFAGSDGSAVVYYDVPKSKERVIKEFLDRLERPDDEDI